jgi:hypothetical protein
MPPSDRLTLGWWQKWTRYRRIPWKFVIHTFLVILTSVQIVFLSNTNIAYQRASTEVGMCECEREFVCERVCVLERERECVCVWSSVAIRGLLAIAYLSYS